MKSIERARLWQELRERNKTNRKRLREQRYRDFLLNPPRHLPGLSSLVRWRNMILIVVFCMIAVPSLQVLLFYDTCLTGWGSVIQQVFFFTSMIVAGFAASLDWAISKRFGNEKSIIQWQH